MYTCILKTCVCVCVCSALCFAALVQQVLSMTDEQIAQLPEGARMQVLQVKQLLVAQGIMPR